jgi:CDP-diacylglycerol--glycerol-3-phosphate 3-phosphatidyltransferase
MSLARSVPNLLTGARIVLAVVVFFALAAAASAPPPAGSPAVWRPLVLLAFTAFAVGALTDFFDGWLARRLNAQSIWGAILDPIADKIAVLSVILGLVWLQPRLGVAAPGFLILFREIFVSGLREVAAGKGVRFPVTRLAKWKTTVQLAALCVELLAASGPLTPALSFAGDALLWIAAAMTLWTGAQYALAARRQLPA